MNSAKLLTKKYTVCLAAFFLSMGLKANADLVYTPPEIGFKWAPCDKSYIDSISSEMRSFQLRDKIIAENGSFRIHKEKRIGVYTLNGESDYLMVISKFQRQESPSPMQSYPDSSEIASYDCMKVVSMEKAIVELKDYDPEVDAYEDQVEGFEYELIEMGLLKRPVIKSSSYAKARKEFVDQYTSLGRTDDGRNLEFPLSLRVSDTDEAGTKRVAIEIVYSKDDPCLQKIKDATIRYRKKSPFAFIIDRIRPVFVDSPAICPFNVHDTNACCLVDGFLTLPIPMNRLCSDESVLFHQYDQCLADMSYLKDE